MESKYVVTSGGLRFHLLIAGPMDAPPLILLHGYPSSSLLWRHIIPHLAQHFRVYAPDLPGHGQSDKPARPRYDLDFFVTALHGLYEALGLKRASIACHDIGGMVGLGFAARHPECLTQLIVMDTVPYADIPFIVQLKFQMMGWPGLSWLLLRRPIFRWFMRKYVVADPQFLSEDTADMYLTPWIQDAAGRRAFSRVIRTPMKDLAEPAANLRHITMPILILWAEKDRVCPLRDARRLHQDLPHARLVTVPNTGHFLQEEQPELIAQQMIEFLLTSPAGTDREPHRQSA